MGIVIKQSIKGTFWIYIGIVIGFINNTYLFTNYLTPEIVGLLGLLVSYSDLFGRLFLLGLQGVTNRLFPYFRNSENGHNGFLFLGLLFHIAGILLMLILYFIFKEKIIENNIEKSPLFAKFFYLLIPLTITSMIFFFLDTYNKLLYDTVLGTFLQEFIQRVLILIITVFYIFNIISLDAFIFSYTIVLSVKAVIILICIIRNNNFKIAPNFDLLDKKMVHEIINVALYSIIGGLGYIVVFSLDKIFINKFLGLAETGVYTIAFFIGTIIVKPSNSIMKISSPLISDALKLNDLNKLKEIYYKSCLNQLIIGGFIFIGIWINIDNIVEILGASYIGVRWVIFFISVGYLVEMSTGANGVIITFSKYYRMSLVFILILMFVTVALMYLLIPIWGIVGAAITIAVSFTLNNLLRYLFLYVKYKLQPFNLKYLIIIFVYFLIYLVVSFIPKTSLYVDILTRSLGVSVLTFLVFWLSPLSEDINQLLSKGINGMMSFLRLKSRN